jgi:hypothetical protein
MDFKKNNLIFLGLIFSGFFWASAAKAVCPVCVVAIGAGVGLCRWLGVDDTISGLWIGGLTVAMIIWTIIWLHKRNWRFSFDAAAISLIYYLLIIWPLYSMNIMGHPLNKIFGMDKLLFGIISGSILFLFCHRLNIFLKKKNQGKVYFPYQKVVIPFLFLIIVSAILHFIIGCQIRIPFK